MVAIYYYGAVDKLSIGNATRPSTLQDLLKVADVITIHVDRNPANANIIDEEKFALMNDGVLLLNLSRGHVVNVEVLAKNLKSGKVASAAIDVFPDERKDGKEPFLTLLQSLPSVLITPHIGGSTEEAQGSIAEFVPDERVGYVATGSTCTSANFHRINLPTADSPRTHR